MKRNTLKYSGVHLELSDTDHQKINVKNFYDVSKIVYMDYNPPNAKHNPTFFSEYSAEIQFSDTTFDGVAEPFAKSSAQMVCVISNPNLTQSNTSEKEMPPMCEPITFPVGKTGTTQGYFKIPQSNEVGSKIVSQCPKGYRAYPQEIILECKLIGASVRWVPIIEPGEAQEEIVFPTCVNGSF